MDRLAPESSVLIEAEELTSRDRGETHGDAIHQHKRAAKLINAAFDTIFTAHDVCLILDLLKTSRILEGRPIRDHYVDKAGYTKLAYDCVEAGA